MKVRPDAVAASLALIQRELHARAGAGLGTYFPADGPHRRELYPKHLAFFRAGATYKERLLMAANRVGKTLTGCYELALHLTGLYPDWWEGRRFPMPIEAWACGTTAETTRDIVQRTLLGPMEALGTGMIPRHLIRHVTRRTHGLTGTVESAWIQHVSGGRSVVGLKTYEQGRQSFEGTARHVILDDEEPPQDIYVEQLYRTATTGGIMMTTFTPLQGVTDVVRGFLEPADDATRRAKCLIQAGWDDVPHLDAAEKATILASTPPYLRAARTAGVPQLGAGVIYPVAEEDIVVEDFPVPAHWPRGYGMDVGWNATAAAWGAYDRAADTLYLYACYKRGEAEPVIHAEAIKARGATLPGRIDPASRGRAQKDGDQLLRTYQKLGLRLDVAPNAVEAGLYEVWGRLSTGRVKVFRSCVAWFAEFRLYHRDEKGRIVKEHDHVMDATRYLALAGALARPPWAWLVPLPVTGQAARPIRRPLFAPRRHGDSASLGWMKLWWWGLVLAGAALT